VRNLIQIISRASVSTFFHLGAERELG